MRKGYQLPNSKKTIRVIVLITGTTQSLGASTNGKKKKYEYRKAIKKQQLNFKISDLESDYTTTDGSNDEEIDFFHLVILF